MAQERPVTPERQLLKLIEDSKGKKGPGAPAKIVKRNKLGLFSFGAWLSRISFFKARLKRGAGRAALDQLEIKLLNRILALCSFALACYFIWSFSMSMVNLEKMSGLKFKIGEGETPSSTPATSALKKSVSHYLDKVSRRNIFEMQARRPTLDVAKQEPTSKIVQETKHLKLVGISWSADPVAMIEDGRSYKTFFSKRGQMIGKVRVEAIFKDKVVLSYDEEEVELR